MLITLNIDDRGYKDKATAHAEAYKISDRVRCQKATQAIEPDELMDLIEQGYTFTPAQISGDIDEWKPFSIDPKDHKRKRIALFNEAAGRQYKTSDFWIDQQIIVADIDNELPNHERIAEPLTPAEANEICRAHNIEPYFMYYTMSNKQDHPKFRICIVLDEPINDFDEAGDLIDRVAELFNTNRANCADTSIEPVKLIFGSKPGCIIEAYSSKKTTNKEQLLALPAKNTAKGSEMPLNEQGNNNLHRLAQNGRQAELGAYNDELEKLIDALNAIDPAGLSYDDIVQFMGVCKNEGIPYSEFDAWASKDTGLNDRNKPRYNPQNNAYKWNTLTGEGRHGKATALSIYQKAWAAGWKPKSSNRTYTFDDKLPAAPDEQEAEYNKLIDEAIQAADAQDAQKGIAEQAAIAPAGSEGAECSFKGMSAADYLTGGMYDKDITYMQQFAGRVMGLHPNIDDYLTLYPGLAVLGGQASLGKTTFAVNMVHKLLERGEHVLYFAFEQTAVEIMNKSITALIYENNRNTRITNAEIKNGCRAQEAYKARDQIIAKGSNYHIYECDFTTTAQDVINMISRYMQAHPGIKPIAVIDYLQLIAPPVNNRGSIREYTDANLKALKGYQKDNGLFIMLLSSFNRSSYLEPVSYESFKETGMIESTCDYVFGLQLTIQDADNDDFYISTGPKGGEKETTIREKRAMMQEAQRQMPKHVQFVSLKSRAGRQNFKANFVYWPAHDFFYPESIDVGQWPEKDASASIWEKIKANNS